MMTHNFLFLQSPLCNPSTGPPLAAPQATVRNPGKRRQSTTCFGNHASGKFDADAWKEIMRVNMFDHAPAEDPSEQSSLTEAQVGVDKVPSFIFFTESGRRREDIVGMTNVATCKKRLETKLRLHLGVEEPGGPSDRKSDTHLSAYSNVADAFHQSGSEVEKDSDGRSDIKETTTGNLDLDAGGIVNVGSKDEMIRILRSRREQEPVVVMYHAPWCRKCSYLARAFRLVAKEWAGNADADRGAAAVLFCRVDVSKWGRRKPGVVDVDTKELDVVHPDALNASGGDRSKSATTSVGGASEEPSRLVGGVREEDGVDMAVHRGSDAMGRCDVCKGSGFVPCGECGGKGAVTRTSPDGRYSMAVICPTCVGYKKLRCEACGGKCYMCD